MFSFVGERKFTKVGGNPMDGRVSQRSLAVLEQVYVMLFAVLLV